MHWRFGRPRAALALLALAAAAACKDQTPTLSGDPFFPGGGRPVTLEAFVPAAQYLQTLGSFSGYESVGTFGALVIANQYGGALSAHALQLYVVPKTVSYSQNGASTDDSLYRVTAAKLITVVDTTASSLASGTTIRLYRVAQAYDPATATWTLAVDSGGVQTPWTTPGGTTGALLGTSAPYVAHQAADSVGIAIDTIAISRTRPDSMHVLLATAPAGTRLQLLGTVLRLTVKPSNAARDTTITVDVTPAQSSFLFTPNPPAAGAFWQAGGIFADRTLFSVNLDQPLPGCAPAQQPCAPVRMKDVLLNRVAIQLRPQPVPLGFNSLAPVPLELWLVKEPELGRRAPLVPSRRTNSSVLDSLRVFQQPGDTLVELPITGEVADQVRSDTTRLTFALIGEQTTPASSFTRRTFGLVRYDPQPRLRIVYTLPVRPTLP